MVSHLKTLSVNGFHDTDCNEPVNVNRHLNTFRDTMANYFVSEQGKLPWQ